MQEKNPIHFGIKINTKYGLHINRDTYATISKRNTLPKFPVDIYEDEECKFYKDDWCLKHKEDALKNYDINMEFYKSLSNEEFNKELNLFLHKNRKFKEVVDLNDYKGKSGYYLLVLDDYNTIYIGTAKDIYARIKQHWYRPKSFDRLLLPMNNVLGSHLSIDSFRALDTTRIYAYVSKNIYMYEDKYINQINKKFLANRINGGIIQDYYSIVLRNRMN